MLLLLFVSSHPKFTGSSFIHCAQFTTHCVRQWSIRITRTNHYAFCWRESLLNLLYLMWERSMCTVNNLLVMLRQICNCFSWTHLVKNLCRSINACLCLWSYKQRFDSPSVIYVPCFSAYCVDDSMALPSVSLTPYSSLVRDSSEYASYFLRSSPPCKSSHQCYYWHIHTMHNVQGWGECPSLLNRSSAWTCKIEETNNAPVIQKSTCTHNLLK